jgi:cytochrome c peroxidase
MKRAPSMLGMLGVSVLVGAIGGCVDETTFTQEERDILMSYQLPAKPPANNSNRFADNSAAAVFGKKIFFDARFSGALGPANDGVSNGSLGMAGTTGKVSCYGCHQIEIGGADKRSRSATSLGVNFGLRNAPTVINAAFWDTTTAPWQLWDGRKDSLWALSLGPLEGANEHNGTRLQYAHLVFDKYKAEYELIFGPLPDLNEPAAVPRDCNGDGTPEVTLRFPPAGKPGQCAFDGMAMGDKGLITQIYVNIGKALEAYERKLVSTNFEQSPFDQALTAMAKDDMDAVAQAMSPGAIRGAKLFIGKAACNECHRGSMFTDFKFHNIGCPQQGVNVPAIDVGRSKGVSLIMADVMNRKGPYSDEPNKEAMAHIDSLVPDLEIDIGSFRTPTLRNIERTGPFMHDGVYTNLWDVVSHYNFGGGTGSFSGTKEAAISPLLLTNDEMDDLVAFLRSLSDGPPVALPDFPEGLVNPPPLPQ